MADLREVETIKNPEVQKVPAVLVLDRSASMSDRGKINQLNNALSHFKEDCMQDQRLVESVEIAIVSFGEDVKKEQSFISLEDLTVPLLLAGGDTPMAEALTMAMDLVEERKKAYKDNDVSYFRPIIFLITDGLPTDMSNKPDACEELKREFNRIKEEIRTGVLGCHFYFQPVGVEPADMDFLKELCPRAEELKERKIPVIRPIKLDEGKWIELFDFLRNSMLDVREGRNFGERSTEELGQRYGDGD